MDIQHTWAQAPVRFEDALGRHHIVPSEYTWDMFEGVILGVFKTSPGRSFVERGAYDLYNVRNPNMLIEKAQWAGFLPGERIMMAMVVSRPTCQSGRRPNESCRSRHSSVAELGGRTCSDCGV